MQVPQLDLKAQHAQIAQDMEEAVGRLFVSQRFVLGETVSNFEAAMAEYLGVPGCIGVASGSEALRIALAMFDIGPGDEVILPAFTFFATAGAVVHVGAKPRFVDIDEDYLLDPADVQHVLNKNSRALIGVHLYGRQMPWGPLGGLAADSGLALIEDAAQSIGSRNEEGRSGSLGDAAAFSFFPSKNLGGAGDGGLLCFKDGDRLERARRYRNHGEIKRYHHAEVGINGRLDALQAAVLQVKLPHLDRWNSERREKARGYNARLGGLATSGRIRLPVLPLAEEHVWHQYTFRADNRDELLIHLHEKGIGAAVYYPVPLHRQACFIEAGQRSLPVTERFAAEVISLPIYPELTDEQLDYVAECVKGFYG